MTIQETWHLLPPRNSNELWNLVSDAWDEVASPHHYTRSLIESMTRGRKSVVEAEGFCTPYFSGKFLGGGRALLRVKVFSFSMRRRNTSPIPVAGWTTASRLQRLWVRTQSGLWTTVFCECCVASAT